jgi:hypothetical protein
MDHVEGLLRLARNLAEEVVGVASGLLSAGRTSSTYKVDTSPSQPFRRLIREG